MKKIMLLAFLSLGFCFSATAKDINININLGKEKKDKSEAKAEIPKDWICTIEAFTDTYRAIGRTKAEAKLNAVNECTAEHDKMHCDDIKCEGPDETTDEDSHDKGWICTLKPFMNEYSSAAGTRAKAKLKVIEKCLAKEGEMFCKDPKCEEG